MSIPSAFEVRRVLNLKTNRMIKVDGPTFDKLVKFGGIVTENYIFDKSMILEKGEKSIVLSFDTNNMSTLIDICYEREYINELVHIFSMYKYNDSFFN
jgi:hypothetical protein